MCLRVSCQFWRNIGSKRDPENFRNAHKHYENMPMQNTEMFFISYGEAVLTSTHNVCFVSKIKKKEKKKPFDCLKVCFKGLYISRASFPDGREPDLFIYVSLSKMLTSHCKVNMSLFHLGQNMTKIVPLSI